MKPTTFQPEQCSDTPPANRLYTCCSKDNANVSTTVPVTTLLEKNVSTV